MQHVETEKKAVLPQHATRIAAPEEESLYDAGDQHGPLLALRHFKRYSMEDLRAEDSLILVIKSNEWSNSYIVI